MLKFSVLILCCAVTHFSSAGVTAEQVLGEYWKVPNFGEAATDKTVKIELLTGRVLPEFLTVPAHTNIRFVFSNISPDSHLIAITADVDTLLADKEFDAFAKDELAHAKQEITPGRGHSHSGNSNNKPGSLVRKLDQKPTVFVKSQEEKEILIRFDEANDLTFFCVLDNHRLAGFIGKIYVVD